MRVHIFIALTVTWHTYPLHNDRILYTGYIDYYGSASRVVATSGEFPEWKRLYSVTSADTARR